MEQSKQNKHPKGLWYLFGTEMWERFGYYLMLGIFSLYMIENWNSGGMGFSSAKKSVASDPPKASPTSPAPKAD